MSDTHSVNGEVNNEASEDKLSSQSKEPKGKALRKAKEAEKKARKEATKLANEKAKREAIEAEEKAKKEAEEAKKARKEEKKARKEATKLAKERAKKEAEEAKKARKEEKKARKEATKLAKEKAKREAEEAKKAKKETEQAKRPKEAEEKDKKEAIEISITAKSETVKKNISKKINRKLYKGEVKLLIMPPVDSKNLKELEDGLRNTKGLKLLLIGGTADGGIQIVVSALKPIPILNALKETPQVEEAISKDDIIYISLK